MKISLFSACTVGLSLACAALSVTRHGEPWYWKAIFLLLLAVTSYSAGVSDFGDYCKEHLDKIMGDVEELRRKKEGP